MSVALSAPASAEASAGAAALPTHIGKYRIIGRLGDGATSEVFLGYDDFQRRNVAIKRVRAGTAGDTSTAMMRSASMASPSTASTSGPGSDFHGSLASR